MKQTLFALLVIVSGFILLDCSKSKSLERKSSDTTYYESNGRVDSFFTSRQEGRQFVYATMYKRAGNEWTFREAKITRRYTVDTIYYEGVALFNDQLKPLRRAIYDEVTGDTLIEYWSYKHQVDSLKRWGEGELHVKVVMRRYKDEGYVYFGTDTTEITFTKPPNTLGIRWSTVPNITGKRDFVSILRENKDFGDFNRIERHGVFQSTDIQLYNFVTQYYDQWKNIGYHFITFYDRDGHAIRGGQVYFPDEKALKEIDTLVNADHLTISQLNGVLHGLWSYYTISESGLDIVAETKAFFQGAQVGNTKEDFVNARYNYEKGIIGETKAVIGGKCSWCKIGTYVNGTCNQCGTVSDERESELTGKESELTGNLSKKIEECPYRSSHYKIQYPYTCDCGYVGK